MGERWNVTAILLSTIHMGQQQQLILAAALLFTFVILFLFHFLLHVPFWGLDADNLQHEDPELLNKYLVEGNV